MSEEEDEEEFSERDALILNTLAKNAKESLKEETISENELIYYIKGMYDHSWLPIETVPLAEKAIWPIIVWWDDDCHLVRPTDGNWVTDCEEYPFLNDDGGPTHWCWLPGPPIEAIEKIIDEAVRSGELEIGE